MKHISKRQVFNSLLTVYETTFKTIIVAETKDSFEINNRFQVLLVYKNEF